RAQVTPEAGSGLGTEVRRRDGRGDLDERDREHPATGPHDVARVPLGDAEVDDPASEAGQVQRGDRAGQLEQDEHDERVPIRTQVLPHESEQHYFFFVVEAVEAVVAAVASVRRDWLRAPSSRTATSSSGVELSPASMGWTLESVSMRR